MAKNVVSDAISRQIFSEILDSTLSKSDKRRKEIIEGAIEAYAAINYLHISYDDIAGPAKTSRRLVQHYFPDKKELFEIAVKVIRAQYQALVIEAFANIKDPRERFCEYIRAAVSWPERLPTHVRAWFLYYLVCSQQPKLRRLHAELAQIGEERIAALVSEFHTASHPELKFIAKTVQRLIAGALIEICAETVEPDISRVRNEIVRACLAVVSPPT